MKTTTKWLALPVLGLLAATLAFNGSTALAATINVPGPNGPTIQAAINAAVAGDTIQVAAGTYAGNITVTKSLTILGDPGDALPGPGVNVPVIDGGGLPGDAFKIANGVTDVTIQGFEMRNFTSPDFDGIGNGISAWVGSTAHITVTDNYFHDLGYNGILVGNDYNSDPAKWGDHTDWLIKNNIIEDFGFIGFELTNTRDSSIEDNVIHMMTPYIGAIFSSARRSESGLTIKNNQIDGTPSLGFPVIYIYAYDGDMQNPTLDNVLIEGNVIASVGTPFQIYILNDGGTITGVRAHYNSLSTFRNLTAATVDATCNWWGFASGPAVGAVMGDVVFTPWLISPTGPCTGGLPPLQIKIQVGNELNALLATITDGGDRSKLQDAINHLSKSVSADKWMDDSHPMPGSKGEAVFNEEKSTVTRLRELRNGNHTPLLLTPTLLQGYIDSLVAADRQIAEIAIAEAIATLPTNASKISTANSELNKGDVEASRDHPDKAIGHYKNAWKNAIAAG